MHSGREGKYSCFASITTCLESRRRKITSLGVRDLGLLLLAFGISEEELKEGELKEKAGEEEKEEVQKA